jgi:predicted lipoprotein with Yx(FWY)xxD motif
MSISAFAVRRPVFALLAVLALAAAACTSGGGATGQPSTAAASPSTAAGSPSATATESASPTESEATEEEEYKIEVAEASSIGKYLTGEDGKTLYIFKKDTKDNESTCTGQCAENWPPFVLDEGEQAEAGDGVTGTIATFDRPDGTKQVSYKGKPLYYFKNDAKAGDINGQGIGDVWFAATP